MPHNIAVAWSGGADSTALLLYLRALGYAVQAWHVDHAWHGDSAVVAQYLAKQAGAWGIPFYCKRLTKPERNLEATAREGRYAALQNLAEHTGCTDVALAHHAGDQAETVCMRLLQGAGVAGCQGMKVMRRQGALRYWRPLLHVSRQHIEEYLQYKHVTWLEDPSNADTRLWRNKIRKRLFPAMQAQGVAVQKLFLRWQKQATRVQQLIQSQASVVPIKRMHQQSDVFCVIDWQAWSEQVAPVRAFLMQQMIDLLFMDGRVFGRRHILAIDAWRKHGGHSWLNLSRCCLYRRGKDLQLCQGKMILRHCTQENAIEKQG